MKQKKLQVPDQGRVAERERSSDRRLVVFGIEIQRTAEGCTRWGWERKREKRETKREKKILEEKETKANDQISFELFLITKMTLF